jgi:hypothetical protein
MKHQINNRKELEPYRKALRNNSTSAEIFLWDFLKNKKLAGRKFRRQHSVGNYILDFYCPDEKLAIELGIKYGSSERTIRKWFKKLDLPKKNEPEPEQYQLAKEKVFDNSKRRFIVTSAQACTPVNNEFLKNIEAYAEHIQA